MLLLNSSNSSSTITIKTSNIAVSWMITVDDVEAYSRLCSWGSISWQKFPLRASVCVYVHAVESTTNNNSNEASCSLSSFPLFSPSNRFLFSYSLLNGVCGSALKLERNVFVTLCCVYVIIASFLAFIAFCVSVVFQLLVAFGFASFSYNFLVSKKMI